MMKLRSRLILAVIAVLAAAFALCDFGVERHTPQQAIQVAQNENRAQPTALQSTRRVGRAAQRWGLGTIWRVKRKLGM
jgi:hypothetical protein